MNLKRSLILLATLVIIFVGAIIAVYPNWLWFENLGFDPVFWTMIVARFGLATVIWLVMIVLLAVNLYIAQRLTPTGGQRSTADIGGFPISSNTLDNLILAAVLFVCEGTVADYAAVCRIGGGDLVHKRRRGAVYR